MPLKRFHHWTSAVPLRIRLTRFSRYPSKLRTVVGDPRPRAGALFPALRELSQRYTGASADLTPHEFRVFSQNGEDGVIAEVVRRIGDQFPRTFVEFGAGAGASGNTVFLADVLGWSGLFIEPAENDYRLLEEKYQAIERVQTLKSFVGPANINTLVPPGGFPGGIGVLSIDVDGNDYYILQALAARPALIVIEYNGALPLRRCLVQPLSDAPWQGTDYFGASLGALVRLARERGYFLVHTELSGTNAFFVADEHRACFADVTPPERAVNYELLGMRHPADHTGRTYIDLDPA